MVGLVIISHSRAVAEGVRELAGQMAGGQDLPVAAAGGREDGGVGTSFDLVERALRRVLGPDGAVILADLGSAVMTAELALETLDAEERAKVRLSPAPLVEGALAAAAVAAAGADLAEVAAAAAAVLDQVKASPVPPVQEEEPLAAEVVVPNPVGLHARPAMRFVQTVARFQAQVTVQNLTQNNPPVDGRFIMQVLAGATARQGETIRITAAGAEAAQALAALRELVEGGFGEMAEPQPRAAPGVAATIDALEGAGGPAQVFKGLGVSPGLAVAPALILGRSTRPALTWNRGLVSEPAAEAARLRAVVATAQAQLGRLQERVAGSADEAAGRIFEFQRAVLDDPQLQADLEAEVKAKRRPAESAVEKVFSSWRERLAALDDVTRARVADLQDLQTRLLRLLTGQGEPEVRDEPTRRSIIVALDLTPSDLAHLNRSLLAGLALAGGGAASHAAILCRAWGIPTVMGLGRAILDLPDETWLALDGQAGAVEANPSPETVTAFQARSEQQAAFQVLMAAGASRPAVTKDGRRVAVHANLGDVDSARLAVECGAEGSGLVRTEFLYLNRAALPSEEEQYQALRAIVEALGQRPVVIRTLDVGGDKQLPYLGLAPELNPYLGLRAIRLCLQRPDIFQPQLRAILRAGVEAQVKIMFPMVATLEEIRRAKTALEQARESLRQRGQAFAEGVEVGIMVETPAAALKADLLAREVDFFSLGSNDLVQYALACDRGHPDLAELYDPWDEAVLRLVRRVVEAARRAGIWVGLCGEFAADPEGIPFLLGLGLDEFSVAAPLVPEVKQRIRDLSYEDCRALAGAKIGRV